MITSVLTIRVRPGQQERFERLFVHELRVLDVAREAAGMLDGEIVRKLDNPLEYLVIARWPNPEAYRVWRTHPVRDELRPHLEGVTEPSTVPGTLYEPVA